ncbi:hypothetical protein TrST_g12158 [Triparma strigata]|nr:hypothetical protein TrST_g12158 [Triparma strigata]
MKVPDSLQKFGNNVFYNCSKLVPSDINVSDSNAVVTYLRAQMSAEQEWQLLSDEEKTKLTVDGKDGEGVGFHGYTKRKHVTKVVFLPNITKVGNFACINAKILVTVDIPEGVESIGDYAFSGCSELKTATIPKSLRNFGKHIFWECTSLVPSDIDVSQEYRDATSTVVTYLRFKQSSAIRVFYEGDLSALKKVLVDTADASLLLKSNTEGQNPFDVALEQPVTVKCIVQTLPDATVEKFSKYGSNEWVTPVVYAKEKKAPQLTIDMLELLTVDEMKACSDTEAEIQAAVDKKKETRAKNKSAIANIVDFTAREKATELQTKMFGELKAAAVDDAQVTFDELKVFCGDQAKRLGDLIAVVMDKYKTTDPRRYEPFEQVKDIAVKDQVPPPATLSLPEQVEFQLANATWYEEGFKIAMNEIAAVFNEAKTCEEICHHYDIDNSGGKWSK